MTINGVKSPEKRLEIVDLSSLFVKAYGANNLYPQQLAQIIAASPSGTLCARRMARFIEGKGFKNNTLYSYVVNRAGQTMDDILKNISADYACFGGFALHINYNAIGQGVECAHIPFENCRIGLYDTGGYAGKIAIHPDWSGSIKWGGKQVKVSKDNIDYIDIYNPNPAVVGAQIEAAGSIENYKGQVLYVSSAGHLTYPTPMSDPVITEMSTEEGLANISYRNARSSFLPAGLLVREKDSNYSEQEEAEFVKALSEFQGDTSTGKIISVTVEDMESAPKIVPFVTTNFDKDFDVTEKRTVEKIYAAFEQEKFYRVRSGSLYYSASIAAIINNDYSDILISERQVVERTFTRIFNNWFEAVSDDYSITPIYNEIIEDNGAPNQ